jgi:lipid-A-disaccharide synthase
VKKSLLIVAGEVSGDMHAARVVEALREKMPDLQCWGIGGDELRAAGVDVLYDVRDMAVLGLWEVLKRYGFFRRVFHTLIKEMEQRKPDAVLLVDYPGFNLRFAKQARQRGFNVLYYICPQVWAWHRSRIGRMAQWINRLMVIFPFEVDVFKGTGVRVDFVGHPLVKAAERAWAEPAADLPWQTNTRVALLPGSRLQEIERILPGMLEAAHALEKMRADVSFLIAAPSERIAQCAQGILDQTSTRPTHVQIVTGQTRQVLRQARAAMVASGTATLETAMMECPMIVVYKTAALTYGVGKRLIQVPHLGMVNIVAGRVLCPEFIQHEVRPLPMAKAMAEIMDESSARDAMIRGLREVRAALGREDSVEKAAAIIYEELTSAPV